MDTTRITATKVNQKLDEHLQEHTLKLNQKLHDVWYAVFGDKGKGGLCDDVQSLQEKFNTIDKRLTNIEDTLKWLVRLIIGAVIMAVLGLVFIK